MARVSPEGDRSRALDRRGWRAKAAGRGPLSMGTRDKESLSGRAGGGGDLFDAVGPAIEIHLVGRRAARAKFVDIAVREQRFASSHHDVGRSRHSKQREHKLIF